MFIEPRQQKIIIAVIFAVYFLLGLLSSRHKTFTTDEERNLAYGDLILHLDSQRISDSEMPFSALNAIPFRIRQSFQPELRFDQFILIPRMMTVIFSLIVAGYVFRWAQELYGTRAGFFSLLLYVLCPNIIAHSQLINTDVYCAGMVTIALYYFWKFLNRNGKSSAFLSATTLGISQLAKYTSVFLYPIFLIIVLCRAAAAWFRRGKEEKSSGGRGGFKLFAKYFVIFVLLNILVINMGFLFCKPLIPWKDYSFKSEALQSIQSGVKALQNFPVLLPYPFVEGLDLVRHNERIGASFGHLYLLGKLKQQGENFAGFNGYYFYAFLFKVPIAIQLFILMALIGYMRRAGTFDFWKNEIFFCCPILFFTVYFNFFYRAQIGIRHFLVAFPLLFIFCGSLAAEGIFLSRRLKVSVVTLFIYLGVSVASYFPHYLSYFNEMVWDRKQAYKFLADSNIDWEQNQWYLEQYRKAHPEAIVNPEAPVAGEIVVGVNDLVGVFDAERFAWLREHFEPVDHIAYSYLVYDISPQELSVIMGTEKNRR